MSSKTLVMLGMFVGSAIGGFVPELFGAGIFSIAGLLGSGVGAIAGIFIAYKLFVQ